LIISTIRRGFNETKIFLMKRNIVKEKSFDFALKIVRLSQILINQKKEFVLSNQLLRAGTSIGANIRESEHAESLKDFIHKLSIALKEANETEYWIELLFRSDQIDDVVYKEIKNDITELLKLLTAILKTSKSKQEAQNNH